MLNIYKNLYLI